MDNVARRSRKPGAVNQALARLRYLALIDREAARVALRKIVVDAGSRAKAARTMGVGQRVIYALMTELDVTAPAGRAGRPPGTTGRGWTRRSLGTPARERDRARGILCRTVAAGTVTRPVACPGCGSSAAPVEGHHTDYSQPLDVTWLCGDCHRRAHGKTGRCSGVQ